MPKEKLQGLIYSMKLPLARYQKEAQEHPQRKRQQSRASRDMGR